MNRGGEAEAEGYFRFAAFLAGLAFFCAAFRFFAVALPPSDEIRARSDLLSLANPVFLGFEEGINDMGWLAHRMR